MTFFIVSAEGCSTDGEVRLVDGPSDREGTVQVCVGGAWGTIHHNSWGSQDATVVCRQLGHSVKGEYYNGNSFPFILNTLIMMQDPTQQPTIILTMTLVQLASSLYSVLGMRLNY